MLRWPRMSREDIARHCQKLGELLVVPPQAMLLFAGLTAMILHASTPLTDRKLPNLAILPRYCMSKELAWHYGTALQSETAAMSDLIQDSVKSWQQAEGLSDPWIV